MKEVPRLTCPLLLWGVGVGGVDVGGGREAFPNPYGCFYVQKIDINMHLPSGSFIHSTLV